MWLLTGELLVSQPSSADVLTVEGQLRGLPAGLYQGNQPMAFENTTSHLFVSKNTSSHLLVSKNTLSSAVALNNLPFWLK